MYFRVSLQYPKRAWVSQVCQKKPKRHIKTPPFLKGKATFAFQTILETYPLAHYLRDMLYLYIYMYPCLMYNKAKCENCMLAALPQNKNGGSQVTTCHHHEVRGQLSPAPIYREGRAEGMRCWNPSRSNQLRLGKLNKSATTLKVKLGLHRITKKEN